MLTTLSTLAVAATPDDPFLWLEDVTGERALAWVGERNAEAEKVFAADPTFVPLRDSIRGILDSDARIPFVSRIGDRYYNFWRDAANPRGLWRRTTLDQYRKRAPAW